MKTDVLIVGGGPVGSTMAYRLKTMGLDVILVDKAKFPRTKPCGGGVDGIFMNSLPEGMEFQQVVEDSITQTAFTLNGSTRLRFYPMKGKLQMTQRSKLDHLLLLQVKDLGIPVHEGCTVGEFSKTDSGYLVEINSATTGTRTCETRVLVGADGVYSQVARELRFKQRKVMFVGAEWDLKPNPGSSYSEWDHKVIIDASINPLGYFWIFPKAAHLNIGWGVPAKKVRRIHELVANSAKQWDLAGQPSQSGYQIPFAKEGEVVKDGAVLVGDAAGTADPTTGAGIGWGVLSGHMASLAISDHLNGTSRGLDHYQLWYDQWLLPSFRAGEAMRNLMIVSLVLRRREPPGIMQDIIRVLEGEYTYLSWRHDHPALHRAGRGIQWFVDKFLVS